MNSRPGRMLMFFVVFLLVTGLAACQSVQVKPKGEILGGVSVGSRR